MLDLKDGQEQSGRMSSDGAVAVLGTRSLGATTIAANIDSN